MDQSVERIRQAVEEMHSAKASFIRVVAVREAFEGQLVWEGIVHVFALGGHPKAKRAYAWSSPIDGSDRKRFYAVLRVPPISSAADAVRAAIVADYRSAL